MSAASDVEPAPAPTPDEAARGMNRFVEAARRRYGANLRGVYLFGSRARGDNRPDSDADIAVVIADGDWSEVGESVALAKETFEILLDYQLDIQPRAIAERHWLDPSSDAEPWLLRNITADARRLDQIQ